VTSIKQEMDLHDKDLHLFTFDEKYRMVEIARRRHADQAVGTPQRQRVVNGTYPGEEVTGNTAVRMGRTQTADMTRDIHAITEGLAMANLSGDRTPPTTRATNSSTTVRSQAPEDAGINFEPDFREWFNRDERTPPTAPVTNSGNNSSSQALFRPEDAGINFEQDFREWFYPTPRVTESGNNSPSQALFRPEDAAIDFEQDFREWFNPDDLDMK